MDISDLFVDWSHPSVFLDGNEIIGNSPEEYDYLLKGDPEPFINALKQNPEYLKLSWVQDVLFDSLRSFTKSKRGRPFKKVNDDLRLEIIADVFYNIRISGLTQTDACRITAEKFNKSYDTIYKDYWHSFNKNPRFAKLFSVLLKRCSDAELSKLL